MARHQINMRIPAAVVDLLDRVCEARGLNRTEVVITGIVAQAEVFGIIPSLTAVLAQVVPEPKTAPDRRERQRLSQQRSRARKRGADIPKHMTTPGPRSKT